MEKLITILVIIGVLQVMLLARLTSILGCLRALQNQATDDEQTRQRIEQHTFNTARAVTYMSSPFMQQDRIEARVAKEYWKI